MFRISTQKHLQWYNEGSQMEKIDNVYFWLQKQQQK